MKSFNDLPEIYKKRIEIDPNSGCWLWNGRLNLHGYGSKSLSKGRDGYVLVHRHVYWALTGNIPEGMTLDHLCRVRRCCNPEHLEPVTHKENFLRGNLNQYTCKTHCPKGHPYAGDNLLIYYKNGKPGRYCKKCQRLSTQKWRTRNGVGRIRIEDHEKRKRTYSKGMYPKYAPRKIHETETVKHQVMEILK